MAKIPLEYRDLFNGETFAHVGTIGPDRVPHVTPVWIDYDAESNRVLINTERHRQKTKNVEANPEVGLSMTDPEDPYRRFAFQGTVEEVTTEGARDHIDELARRYTDAEEYQMPIQSERVIWRIRPDRILDA